MEHYITHGGTPWLDFNHTVFGQVFYGMDVVDAIAATDAIGDRPVDDVIIERIEIVRK
ncbi:MAG: peptidylprolyl isomerase [Defluviitaleaceae bacterium]|nr:peptidylprolyl isomerase [Defluviitaleaceae bacterium]